jgi:hypothetical protein
LLVARAPANFNVHGGTTAQIAVPRVTPGMPSELLYQRPDIRLAEAQLASSNFSVEAARAAFFPQIQLTAQTGVQSAALASLFGPGAWFYTLSSGLTQPLFDGFLLESELKQAKGSSCSICRPTARRYSRPSLMSRRRLWLWQVYPARAASGRRGGRVPDSLRRLGNTFAATPSTF